MLKKSDNYCYQQRIKSNRKVERVIIKLGAIEKSRILLLQHGKNYQFDSEPKIILHFGTQMIFTPILGGLKKYLLILFLF